MCWAMSVADIDSYLRYKRPDNFQFQFPAGKKFVWVLRKSSEADNNRFYVTAEVLETLDSSKEYVIRVKDSTQVC